MSADGTGNPPPYVIPMQTKGDNVKVYHVHTPFTPPSSTINDSQAREGADSRNRYVSYDSYELGRNPGMATCTNCQQQVLTNVTYKVGVYAWLMCLLFILCGLVACCCLIPFFVKYFKDVCHTCPKCNKIIHIEKKRCC